MTTGRSVYFVLSDVLHPDWQAEVDGVASAVEVANYAFRAVYLEPGSHTVTMRFTPTGWSAGLIATVIALIILIGMVIQYARSENSRRVKTIAGESVMEEKIHDTATF